MPLPPDDKAPKLNEQQEARMRERIEAGEPMSVEDWKYIFAVDAEGKDSDANKTDT